MNSASHQKQSKLQLSASFDSDSSEDNPQVEQMIKKILSTLTQSKILPQQVKLPEFTLSNLQNLVNTLCDEFLLEIDMPTSRTHCSTEENCLKPAELSLVEEEYEGDLLKNIFSCSKPFVVNSEGCKMLRGILTGLVRNRQNDELRNKLKTLQEKTSLYGETLINTKRDLRRKTNEIEKLKKEIEELKKANSTHIH